MKKNLTQGICNVTRTAEDAIINCLKEDEPSWENVLRIPNSTLEIKKLYFAKKKAKAENQQYGNSLEAVAAVRSKLFAQDLPVSYIFFKW